MMVKRYFLSFFATLFFLVPSLLQADTGSGDQNSITKVVILGTGTPVPDPERSGPSVAVVINNQAYIVDFGPGVVRQAAAAAAKNGIETLQPSRLNLAFATHLHSDHTVGLADLLFSPWVLGREVALNVYGPPGIAAMAEHTHAAYLADIDVRINGYEPGNATGHNIAPHEIKPGLAFADDNVRIEAFQVNHGSWDHAYGYKFVSKDRVVVISGDTRYSDNLIKAAQGADILVHEVYATARFKTLPPEWQRYHASFHTSTTDLAEIAKRTQPKLLVLYHQLYWGGDDDDLIAEIRAAGYQGAVVSAVDLGVY